MQRTSLYAFLARMQYVVLPGLIPKDECSLILDEILAGEFSQAEPYVGKRNVEQRFFKTQLVQTEGKHLYTFKKIMRVQKVLTHAIGENIQFNDFSVNRYFPGEVGIGVHRDNASFKNCIALFLLRGQSNLYIHDDETGKNPKLVDAAVGDCILIRASGVGKSPYGPYHSVSNIKEERISLALREKTFLP